MVVVAIIGVLASVVLASLNSARSKGTAAAIKSNLKNMGAQMEIAYSDNGNYSGINPSNADTTCQGPIAGMATAISNSGATVRCLSYNNSTYSDVYQRWGASGIKYSATSPIQAWSSDSTGAVTWDAKGVNYLGVFVDTDVVMSWAQANTACSIVGGRLPSMEELRTLSDATFVASNGATRAPPGFIAQGYWSSTTVPSDSTSAYGVATTSGNIPSYLKTSYAFVRCVR